MQPVIRFENVGKLYRLGTVGTGTLSHDLRRWWITSVMRREDPYLKIGETNDRSTKGASDYVYALRDINLEVNEGDVLGIIGKNGAGKSTLLKLLSRVTAPTTGKIYTRGRIASLLEVGTGFHPELTGRENIYMNGCILGMKRYEIDKKLDEIVDFSGCERYIDTPVKRYSSGMMVRLGFAVAAHLDPEILVVDEVLAVGDAEFQKKAIGKMQEVSRGQGRTVLFVSHNMNAIQNLCHNAVIIEKGQIDYIGSVEKAIDRYTGKKIFIGKTIKEHISQKVPYIDIHSISFNNSIHDASTIKHNQKFLEISVTGVTSIDLTADLAFNIYTPNNTCVVSYDEGHFSGYTDRIKAGEFSIQRIISLPEYLYRGDYIVSISLHHPGVTQYFKADDCIKLHIEGSSSENGQILESSSNGFGGLKTMKL